MYKNSVINNFSALQPRNSTDTNNRKKVKDEITKEGVVVNTFIKDPETYYADSPVQNTPLPKAMLEKKENNSAKWYNNPIVPIIAAPLLILGIGAGAAKLFKNSLINKNNLLSDVKIPDVPRMVTLNNDNRLVLYAFIHDPSTKTLLTAAAVLAASATGFMMKNVVDGVKEIWVKKKFADIKRDKEEKLIDIETRSFSGKNQIIRSLMSQKNNELNSYDNFLVNQENSDKKQAAFGNKNNNKDENKNDLGKIALYSGLCVATIGLSLLFAKSIFKNIGKMAQHLEAYKSEIQQKLGDDLKNISQQDLKKTLENSSATAEIKQSFVNDCNKAKSNNTGNSVFEDASREVYGSSGKTIFSAVVSHVSSFIYTYMINKSPQTRNLAILLCSSAAFEYVGEKAIEGIKETQVEKANAKTEIDLQDRLVQVELNNFYRKKNSYIQPLMEDYKEKIKQPLSINEIKKLKENVLSEIKSGPPFVYS